MAASSSGSALFDAVAACLTAEHDVEAIVEILSEEFIGSTLDVMDAIGHLLEHDEDPSGTAEKLFNAYRSTGHKRPRLPSPSAVGGGLDQFEWKREFMDSTARFERPYVHSMYRDGPTLTLQQAPFRPEGFASTIWDSAIVLARYLERHADQFRGRHCIELGAGCGLPGLVLHALGADVTLTDLEGNLELLGANARANVHARAEPARVLPLRWGNPPLPDALDPFRPFDVILATDVLYSHEAVEPLISTLVELAREREDAPSQGEPADVLLAAGRNRHAGDAFFASVCAHFDVHEVPRAEMDPTYQCEDVAVWRLVLKPRRAPSNSGGGLQPAASTQCVLEVDGAQYSVCADSGALQHVLADGTAGPVVGHVDGEGGITIDEAAWAGEWVTELLTAKLPHLHAACTDPLPPVPDAVTAAIARGGAAEWRGALDPSLVVASRAEVGQLDAAGAMTRRNHAQESTTRGDRVAFLDLSTGGATSAHKQSAMPPGERPSNDGGGDKGGDHGCEDDDDEDDNSEDAAPSSPGVACPPSLRRVFAHLEHIGRSVQEALGCGQLLTPRLGMVATYDDSRHGYVCHMDNERYTADGQASGFRNYRVLTVIAYLNDDVWCESDGGHLRCFAPQRGEGADAANWVPTTESQAAGQGSCELEVLPTGGTVVVFPSCLVPHEVRPARRARTAATLWLVSSHLLRPDVAGTHAHVDGGGENTAASGTDGSAARLKQGKVSVSSTTIPRASWSCTGVDPQAMFGAASGASVAASPGTNEQFSFGF